MLCSGFLHSIWNLYTKKSMNKKVFLWYCQLVAVIALLPWAIIEWDNASINATGWWIILASTVLHGLYTLLLAAAYSAGDLSQVYPIMRGTSPLLVPLIGVTMLDESLSIYGWLGVATIVAGILSLSDIKLLRRREIATGSWKAPLLALAVGVCIASYIVVDKMALAYAPPVLLNEITTIGNLIALTWGALASGGMKQELVKNGRTMLVSGIIAPGGYLLFLFALSLGPVAQLAPMREIGTVFGSVMGIMILREKQGARRIASSLLITAGVITLGFS
ncbi:DMT family transporter [Paenibacillus harenae]|nr:DMT family transporter [Paenibacillus harenae]